MCTAVFELSVYQSELQVFSQSTRLKFLVFDPGDVEILSNFSENNKY